MHACFRFLKNHFILTSFFLFLIVCLFLGDGQQMIIDTVGAAGVLILTLVAFLYGKKQRDLPLVPTLLWGGLLLYYSIRTVWSDDIGYSVYATIRMMDAFLIFSLFYCYTTEDDRRVFPSYVLGFSLFALIASCIVMLVPSLGAFLPKSNLLIPNYGHNHVVDILLFGIPVALFGALFKKNRLYVFLLAFLLFGVLMSFARAAMVLVGIFFVITMLVLWKKISLRKKIVFCGGIIVIGVLASLFFFIPNRAYQSYMHTAIIPKMEKTSNGIESRLGYFRQALKAIQERPLFGSGPGTFILVSKRFQNTPDSYSRYVHNVILEEWSNGGTIGVLLYLLLLFSCVRLLFMNIRLSHGEERRTVGILSCVLILSFCYALLDFTMSFFVVFMLFWSTLGLSIFWSGKIFFTPIASQFAFTLPFIILGIFYFFQFLYFSGLLPYHGIFRYMYFLGEFQATNYLETHEQIDQDSETMIASFHKKNPTVLALLGEQQLQEACRLSPREFSIHKKYFDFLVQKKRYQDAGLMLRQMSFSFLSEPMSGTSREPLISSSPVWRRLTELSVTNPHLMRAYSAIPGSVFVDRQNDNTSFATYFYALGLFVIHDDPQLTEQLWRLASLLKPEWSYYWVELASLYYYQFHDSYRMQETLSACMLYPDPRDHCARTNEKNIKRPGFFFSEIKKIPSPIGSFEKQFTVE